MASTSTGHHRPGFVLLHVQLSYKTREVVVLKVHWKNTFLKFVRIDHNKLVTGWAPRYQILVLWIHDHAIDSVTTTGH
jgi:hypothetical protein